MEFELNALIARLETGSYAERFQITEVLLQIGKPAIPPLCGLLLHSASPEARVSAATLLPLLGKDDVVDSLCQAMQDTNAEVRRAVVYALGQAVSPQSLTALLSALTDEDSVVRYHTVNSLGGFAFHEVELPLALTLITDPDKDVQIAAARTLSRFMSPPALIVSLLSNKQLTTEQAVMALVKMQVENPEMVKLKSILKRLSRKSSVPTDIILRAYNILVDMEQKQKEATVLLRASHAPRSDESQILLRAATNKFTSDAADTLLRASCDTSRQEADGHEN